MELKRLERVTCTEYHRSWTVWFGRSSASLTLFSMAFWPTYLAWGGRGFLIFGPKNQSLRGKQCTNLKYRQLLRSRKKLGPIPPKLGPYRGNENFCQNVENCDSGETPIFKNFDLLHENGSSLVIFGRIHLILFAYGHWQANLGVGWGNLGWSPWFVAKFWGRSKKFKILRIRNLLPTRLWTPVAQPRKIFLT